MSVRSEMSIYIAIKGLMARQLIISLHVRLKYKKECEHVVTLRPVLFQIYTLFHYLV